VTSRIPVLGGLAGYQAAVAELPLRARQARDAAGAIVVVPGDGNWSDRVRDAAGAGARAVIVSCPAVVPAAEVHRLRDDLGRLPVIVERALFRSDASSDVVAARAAIGSSDVRLVAVDGAALPTEVGTVLQDAIGWVRVLARGALTWHAASAGLALSNGTGSGDVPVALNVVQIAAGGSWIRAHALAEVRSEVEASAERTVVITTGEHGALLAPARFETPQRLVLRRAIHVLEGGDEPLDLAELAADAALAEQLTGVESL
jgi:hypothetical protein